MKGLIQNSKKLLPGILLSLAAFFTKLGGLGWGFPGTLHNDESVVIRSAMGMRFGDFNPHHFDWPSLYFYINYFFFWIFIKLRTQLQLLFGVGTMQQKFPFWWGPDLPFYLIGRILSSGFNAASVFLTYYFAIKLFKKQSYAILASAIFAVGTWTTYTSFFALSDNALLFFMLLSLYFCTRILKSDSWKNYIFAAAFAGLATSLKYSGAIICLSIPIAHWLKSQKIKELFNKKIFTAGFISLLAFFVGSPYALLDWRTFMVTGNSEGALWQSGHMGIGTNWIFHIAKTIPQNFGWPLALLGYFGIILVLQKRKSQKLTLLAAVFTIIWLFTGSWGIARAHYSIPTFPILAIFAAYAYFHIIHQNKIHKHLQYIILATLLIFPIVSTSREIISRNRTDTRILAGRWINENIPQGSVIYSIKARTGYYGGSLPVFDYNNYELIIGGDAASMFEKTPSTYLVVTGADIDSIENNTQNNTFREVYRLPGELRTGDSVIIYAN